MWWCSTWYSISPFNWAKSYIAELITILWLKWLLSSYAGYIWRLLYRKCLPDSAELWVTKIGAGWARGCHHYRRAGINELLHRRCIQWSGLSQWFLGSCAQCGRRWIWCWWVVRRIYYSEKFLVDILGAGWLHLHCGIWQSLWCAHWCCLSYYENKAKMTFYFLYIVWYYGKSVFSVFTLGWSRTH